MSIEEIDEQIPAHIRAQLERVKEDCQKQFEQMEKEQGHAFSEGVRAMLSVHQMNQILQMSGAPNAVLVIHSKLCSQVLACTLAALDMQLRVSEIDAWASRFMEKLEPINAPTEEHTTH